MFTCEKDGKTDFTGMTKEINVVKNNVPIYCRLQLPSDFLRKKDHLKAIDIKIKFREARAVDPRNVQENLSKGKSVAAMMLVKRF